MPTSRKLANVYSVIRIYQPNHQTGSVGAVRCGYVGPSAKLNVQCVVNSSAHGSALRIVRKEVSYNQAGTAMVSHRCQIQDQKPYILWSSLRIRNEKQQFVTGWSELSSGLLMAQAVMRLSWAWSNAIVPNSSQYLTLDSSVSI